MNPSGTQSALTMSRNRSGGATPDGTWDDTAEAEVFDEEWTEEKEQHLVSLEQKLKKANRQWSDEQEEILGPVSYPNTLAWDCPFANRTFVFNLH